MVSSQLYVITKPIKNMKNLIKSLTVESIERLIGSPASTNQFEAQVDMVKLNWDVPQSG
jgi:hypothetical protein